MTENEADIETYEEMARQYIAGQTWITPADRPLTFHLIKISRQLDSQIERAGETQAAKDSAYLQAVERLNRRRPGEKPPGDRDPLPGQMSIFDEMS